MRACAGHTEPGSPSSTSLTHPPRESFLTKRITGDSTDSRCLETDTEKLEHFGESTPMGRPGQPNEVAPAFLFLACEDACYMSDQVLHPNGGTIVNG